LYAIDYVYTKNYKQIDLHKHFVDDLLVKNPETKNTLKRIPEVLDCWFES
jgi:isoleucyl-tRNA synthetase